MESLSLEEENIIKDITTRFRLEEEQNYIAVKGIRNISRLKKEINGVKDFVLRNIKNLFEYEKEEESYYKLVRVNNFCSNNYLEYKGNSDSNKTLSVEEYLDKSRPYLKDINNLKKSDTWKIQLTITINFILLKMINNDEEYGMYSKSDDIEIMISDETDEINSL